LELYFSGFGIMGRPGGYGDADIWVTTRATVDDPWGEPVNLGEAVNTPDYDSCPYLSPDGLVLFLHSFRPGGPGGEDMWVTTRPTTSDSWGSAVPLPTPINSTANEGAAGISADGFTFYFVSTRAGGEGGQDIYQAPIITIVDLNDDGIVDAADMCIMVDHWGTDEPLCDIGPMPWGDGIVDVKDLIVLAEHLFTYPGALAYWKLDEAEGDIAQDSANDNSCRRGTFPHCQFRGKEEFYYSPVIDVEEVLFSVSFGSSSTACNSAATRSSSPWASHSAHRI